MFGLLWNNFVSIFSSIYKKKNFYSQFKEIIIDFGVLAVIVARGFLFKIYPKKYLV